MKKLFLIAALFILFSAGYAHAQTQTASQFCTDGSCTYVPLEPLPGLPDCYGLNPPSTCKNVGNFAGLIGNSFKLLIGAGAVIAVVMIILGALTYMFSDIVGNKKKALDRIRGAMWAVVLLVSSYLILVTINPDLVKFNLDINPSNNFNTTPDATGAATPAPAATNQPQSAQTQVQAPLTQDEINKCQASGGYYTFTNGTNAACIPTAPL